MARRQFDTIPSPVVDDRLYDRYGIVNTAGFVDIITHNYTTLRDAQAVAHRLSGEGWLGDCWAVKIANPLHAYAWGLYNALHDILMEQEKFGGVPDSSPALEYARRVMAGANPR